MHDIWNPWHGCRKKSEGCEHCYMYYLDSFRDIDSSVIARTGSFKYPLSRNKDHTPKIKAGETIRVCMTSDFFIEEADTWRNQAWNIMKERSDVIFFLLTKRPERIRECLPVDWDKGWENIMLNVTCENQKRADERIPLLLDIPAKHKGIMCAPFIGPVHIRKYLETGQIEQVIAGGENYDGARPCHYEWVRELHDACYEYDVTFCFIETGTVFIKDGKTYHIPSKTVQSQQAYRSGLSFQGKKTEYLLTDAFMNPVPQEELYTPHFRKTCLTCGSRLICNGCSDCGKCQSPVIDIDRMTGFYKK